MYFFYLDESGNNHGHHDPLISGETPLFVLTTLAVHACHWRKFTQEFTRLKARFFSVEIGPDRHPQYYEIKGSSLLKPRNRTSARRAAFTHKVFDLIHSFGGKLFAVVFIKNPQNPASKIMLYTKGLQILSERFHAFLEEVGDPGIQGLMMLDSVLKHLDRQVAESYLSFVFGNQDGRQFTKLVEAPVFVDSKLSAGVQLADIVSSVVYSLHHHSYCSGVGNAPDYSHALRYRADIEKIQWSSQERYDGWYLKGIRVIDHNS